LSGVDHIDAAFDSLFGAWSFTSPLVDLIGISERVWMARALTLIWELAVDLILALPALGYHEKEKRKFITSAIPLKGDQTAKMKLKAMFQRFKTKPTPIRLVRPFASAAVVIAG